MLVQLLALATLAALSLLLFFPLNSANGRLQKSSFIQRIPFIPVFIIPYLALFPYVAFSMLIVLFFTPVASRLYVSLIFSGLVAAFIWYCMPTVVLDRPTFTVKGPFTKIVAWIYRLDPGGNALPSSHACMAVLCSYYLTFAFPLHEVSIWACGATIVSSTLFVKQHHLIDLVAGIILAAVSIVFSFLILGSLS
ncbi:phosphatase PAP2 family protein [Candidatus Kaiserbacteria bacterium]|nr:phosphatase PAP2 family protein [Candidatus Kaiserbacteria bacterium]